MVACLLLVVMVAASSVVTYSWVMSMVYSQSQQTQTQIRIEAVAYENNASGTTEVAVTVRNMGSVTAILDSVSVASGQSIMTATLTQKISIPTGQKATYTFAAGADGIALDWRWILQKAYMIRATTTTGFYYETIASSPSISATPS